jgi:hypothetical protein
MLVFLLTFLSCKSTDKDPTIVRWQQNPTETIEWLKKLKPLQRQKELQALLEHYPQLPVKVCIDAETNSKFELCSKYKQRPHLFENIQQYENNKNSISLIDNSISTLLNISPQAIVCESKKPLHCVSQTISINTSLSDIAGRCNSLEVQFKSECYFQSADQYQGTISTISKQVQLCHAAQPYGDRCLNHMIDQVVERLLSNHKNSSIPREVLQDIDEQLILTATTWQNKLREAFWSYASFRIIENRQPDCTRSLFTLPLDLHPYVNASAAYFYYIELERTSFASLIEQTDSLQKISCPTSDNSQKTSSPPKISDFWSLQGPYPLFIEEETTKIPYLRKTHRLMSSDPQLEKSLIWLEAAAQHQDWTVVEQALRTNNKVLEWRAKMILDDRKQ